MVLNTSGLIVRQYERAGIQLPVEFTVALKHADQVRFSASSTAMRNNTISALAVDISTGGMGLECVHFLPRTCEGTLRVIGEISGACAIDLRTGDRRILLEHPVQVRRVSLIGREPRYSIGVAFINPTPEVSQRVGEILTAMNMQPPNVQPPSASERGGEHA